MGGRLRDHREAHQAFHQKRTSQAKEGIPQMKAIPVNYRATFQQPIRPLNRIGARFSADIEVEIFQSGDKWLARRPGTSALFEVTATTDSSSMKQSVEQCFERRVTPWSMLTTQGVPVDA